MPIRRRPLALAPVAVAILAAPLLGGATPAVPKDEPPVFRQACIGCHSVGKDGTLVRLDGLRASPEEWDNILRRMGRRGFTLSEAERHQLVKQISKTRGLAPEELQAVSYLNVSPAANLQESVPNHGDFKATCVSCHSWAKIASHRRSPGNWKALRDFHLAMFPASLTQSYREMNWWDTSVEATAWLGQRLPYETPEWRRWKARNAAFKAAGAWVIAGHQPTKGDYEATLRLTPVGDDEFKLAREVRWADGRRETFTGKATLYGGTALRAEWGTGAQKAKASWVIGGLGDGDALDGAWATHHAIHYYGTERGARLRQAAGRARVLRVSPAWLQLGAGKVDVTVTTDGPVGAGFAPAIADGAVQVKARKVLDATHVRFTLAVGAGARRGTLALGLGGEDKLVVARGVDYVKVSPEKGTARLGGQAVPPDGVPYEAIAWSNGPDGARHTADDQALGPVAARWSLAESFTTFEDDDLPHVGGVDASGLFMPNNEADVPTYTKGNNGQVWVHAEVARPGKRPLRARGYLNVTAPDLVKPIR